MSCFICSGETHSKDYNLCKAHCFSGKHGHCILMLCGNSTIKGEWRCSRHKMNFLKSSFIFKRTGMDPIITDKASFYKYFISVDSSKRKSKIYYFFFSKVGCGPCERIKPTVDELAEKFQIYNIDKTADFLVQHYSVKLFPFFIKFDNDEEIESLQSSDPEEVIKFFN